MAKYTAVQVGRMATAYVSGNVTKCALVMREVSRRTGLSHIEVHRRIGLLAGAGGTA